MTQSDPDLLALKEQILSLTQQYSRIAHRSSRPGSDSMRLDWVPGQPIPYAARVFTETEVQAAVSSTLDFWLTLGVQGARFESELANFLGVSNTLLVNSGSSANLIAISSLTSPKIPHPRRLLKGDQVITVSAGFPTTVAPIIQVGAVPVFLDVNPKTANIDVARLKSAYTPGVTKAVVLAHALGNPFDIYTVLSFCREHELWLIEDNCDSLGSIYSMPTDKALQLGFSKNSPGIDEKDGFISRWTGTWGDISTQSFYPPHHLTMGEGGAVNIVSSKLLKRVAESFRDWGRDCWCPSGVDNSCNKRFDWSLGDLPSGYDHKYTYSHLGFNLKPLDIQAAIGREQLLRLPEFILERKRNWTLLRSGLDCCSHVFEFALPTHALSWSESIGFEWDSSGCQTTCSWFGFMISVKSNAPFTRTALAKYLDSKHIGNRMFFGGNLPKQPAFVSLAEDDPSSFLLPFPTPNADLIMNQVLFIGTYPGLTKSMIQYEIDTIKSFVFQF